MYIKFVKYKSRVKERCGVVRDGLIFVLKFVLIFLSI